MLKTHMAACLVATALAAVPAFAQSTTAPSGATDRPTASGSGSATSGSPAMQPGSSPSMGAGGSSGPSAPSGSSMPSGSGSPASGSSGSSMAQTGGAGTGQFMTQQQPGQWLASRLIGTTVVGANNESIGDVNDVLMERDGRAAAVVVGVGGFLGIGEKDVAVAFSALEFSSRGTATAGATGSAAGTSTTGTTGATGAAGGTARSDAAEPDRIVLRMSRQDLQNAPRFARAGSNGGAAGGDRGTTAAPGGSGTAPRQ
jgi:hypothetical protein